MPRQRGQPETWEAWAPGPALSLPCHEASSADSPSLHCGLLIVGGGMTTVPPSEDARSGKPSHRRPTTGLHTVRTQTALAMIILLCGLACLFIYPFFSFT